MEWLVGMDLSDSGHGALAYAGWLHGASGGKPEERFVGVHVLEEAVLQPLLRYHRLEELERSSQEAADRAVTNLDVGDAVVERRIVCGRSVESVLSDLARRPGVRGLIIGRQAKRGEKRIVRLGRVARRLLRTLAGPTVVVPPDLRPDAVGDGPILLAVDTDDTAAPAVAFARSMAEALGRPLSVVHVIPSADVLAGEMIPAGLTGDMFRDLRHDHEHRLRIWMRAHDLAGVPSQVVEGSVIDRLVAVAREARSPLVVCGSRGMGLGMRMFVASVATDLAASCEVPVAVVPNRTAG